MHLGISILIPSIAIFTYAVLLIIVSLSRPKTQAKSAFRVYLMVMFSWSITALLVVLGVGNHTFWFRMMTACITAVPLGLFHFVQVTLSRPKKWARLVYVYGFIIIPITIFTNHVVKWAEVKASGIYYEFSFLMALVAVAAYAVYTYSLIELARALRESDDPQQRNRLQYLMIGLVIVILASVVNFTPLGKYPIDVAGTAIAALVLSYAVIRHQLLEIEVVLRKSLMYFVPTTIIGASYFLIITLVIRVFAVFSGAEILITSMLVAILSAIIV